MTDRVREPAHAGESYEALRQRLISKGYLERRLDRFVLSGAVGPGSFLARHARVSFKVALATGPLLGLLFALAVVLVNRPRLSRPLDALLLAAYFSLAFGVTVFVLELAAGLLLAAVVRLRKRGIAGVQAAAARAGLAVSLLLSAYLAFWWKGRVSGGGGILLDTLGLLTLVLVNAALLRVSSLASLAALIRVSDLPAALPARRRGARGLLLAAATSLVVLVFFLAPRGLAPGAASVFEPSPAAGRLLVVAWDGIPPDVFARWVAGGASGSLDRWGPGRSALFRFVEPPGEPSRSRPGFWIGIATGRRSAEHGVGDVTDTRVAGLSSPLGGDLPLATVLRALLPGRQVAVSAGIRKAPALWEILSGRDGVGAVGWWATWPAVDRGRPGQPFALVTDRAILTLERPREGDYRVAPPALARELGRQFDGDLRDGREEVDSLLERLPRGMRSAVERSARIDAYAATVASRILADGGIEDLFLYLPGLDILRGGGRVPAYGDRGDTGSREGTRIAGERMEAGGPHREDRLAGIGRPGRGAGAEAIDGKRAGTGDPGVAGGRELEENEEVVAGYVTLVGSRIRRLASALSAEDWLVVIGDAGRAGYPGGETGDGRPLRPPDHPGDESRAPRTPTGSILIAGPGVLPPHTAETWSSFDIAPSLLNLRGFPRSREMAGGTRVSFLGPEWRLRGPLREIDTYGESPTPPTVGGEALSEQEILERLRSLGYVQ